jgi:hypothetical protein
VADATRKVTTRFDGNANDLVRAADRGGDALERFARRARLATLGIGALATGALALGPALLPILAAATAATIGLSGALAGAGAAMGVFGAVVIGNFLKAKEVIDEVKAAQKRLDAADTTAQRKAAADDLADAQKKLTGDLGKTAAAYIKLDKAWSDFLKKNEPRSTAGLTALFSTLALVVPKLQPLFDVAATAAEKFFKPFQDAVTGGTFDKFVAFLSTQAGPALDSLSGIIRNVGVGLANMLVGFAPVGQSLLDWLEEITLKFRQWSEDLDPTGSGFGAFIEYVKTNGPQLGETLGQVGDALVTIAEAVGPLAPLSLALAAGLAGIVAAIPPDVLGGIVVAIIAINTALAGMNLVLLANPISLIVLAIGGLIVALTSLWQTSQTAREVMVNVFANIGGAVLQFAEIAIQGLSFVIENMLSFIGTLVTVTAKAADAMGMDAVAENLRESAGEIDEFKNSVVGNMDAAVGKIDEWQAALEAMPKEVRLKGEIADLKAKIADAKANIKTVPVSHQTAILAETRRMEGQLRRAQFLIDAMHGKTITISVRTNIPAGLTARSIEYYTRRQHGGPVLPGRTYLVGEKGPEVLTMGSHSGFVTANDKIGGGFDERKLAGAVAAAINGATLVIDDRGRGRLLAREADLYARAG